MHSTTRAASTPSEPTETLDDMGSFLAHLELAVAAHPDDAPRALRSLADHARKVRASTFRRTTELLDEGSREADGIVAQSMVQAERILLSALAALDRRVDEAGHVGASARAAVAVELRGAS